MDWIRVHTSDFCGVSEGAYPLEEKAREGFNSSTGGLEMSWRDDLLEAIRNKDSEELRKIAALARNRYEPMRPVFDYKKLESEGREPGSDDE
jgi:hypothetical protein